MQVIQWKIIFKNKNIKHIKYWELKTNYNSHINKYKWDQFTYWIEVSLNRITKQNPTT